jgi:ABC-type transporter Mla subunit MlaD
VRITALAALAALGLGAGPGCDKPDDRPALQQEVLATAGQYDRRLDQLAERADELAHRLAGRRALRATLDRAAAEHRLAQARSVIEDRRGYLTSARARLRPPGSVAELHALVGEMHVRLSDGVVEATADLAAVEGWLAAAAQAERAGAQGAPAEPEPEPESPPPAPETDRSGAPIR